VFGYFGIRTRAQTYLVTRTATMPRPARPRPQLYNRIGLIMTHTVRYAFRGLPQLAADCGIFRSTFYRIARGEVEVEFSQAEHIAQVLSKALEVPLSVREVFSPDGTYPTPSCCALCGCLGCRPTWAHTKDGTLRPEHRRQKPSDWTLAPLVTQPTL
jgi:transcriptional regulator with XRE-family HTH domain